jgi:hypothetical protein
MIVSGYKTTKTQRKLPFFLTTSSYALLLRDGCLNTRKLHVDALRPAVFCSPTKIFLTYNHHTLETDVSTIKAAVVMVTGRIIMTGF